MLAAPEAKAERQHDIGAAGERFLKGAANGQRMFLRNRALAGAARIDRNRRQLDELLQLGRGVRPEEAVAAGDQRTFGRMQQFDRAIDFGRVASRTNIVWREALTASALLRIFALRVKNVLRNLDQRNA